MVAGDRKPSFAAEIRLTEACSFTGILPPVNGVKSALVWSRSPRYSTISIEVDGLENGLFGSLAKPAELVHVAMGVG